MLFDIDLARRLQTLGIDDETRRKLKEIIPLAAPLLDDAIETAFKTILKHPEPAKAYAGIKMEDAKKIQGEHWTNYLLPTDFTDEKLDHAVGLFSKRERQGLHLRWYFVFYRTLASKLIEGLSRHYAGSGFLSRGRIAEFTSIVQAFNSLVFFELEVASASYLASSADAKSTAINGYANELDQNVMRLLEQIASSALALTQTAQSMAATAEQTNRQAATVASASERASASVQTVASAAEELSASINEIARQVEQSNSASKSASEEASLTNETIKGLAESSSRIGEVVTLINGIAAQTNLLALNATIEAARAGEAGKGFAVVAGEVKNLANQTAKATDEITVQIANVQAQTLKAVEAIGGIVRRIEEISHISTAIASAVEEQSAATAEIAGNVAQAAQGTELVTNNIGGVSEAAGMTGTASQQVLSSAQSLSGEADHLKDVVSVFVQKIRSATVSEEGKRQAAE